MHDNPQVAGTDPPPPPPEKPRIGWAVLYGGFAVAVTVWVLLAIYFVSGADDPHSPGWVTGVWLTGGAAVVSLVAALVATRHGELDRARLPTRVLASLLVGLVADIAFAAASNTLPLLFGGLQAFLAYGLLFCGVGWPLIPAAAVATFAVSSLAARRAGLSRRTVEPRIVGP